MTHISADHLITEQGQSGHMGVLRQHNSCAFAAHSTAVLSSTSLSFNTFPWWR